MSLKRFLSVPVISVASLATFVYYVTVFIFLEDCLGLWSFSGSSNALIFSIFAFLCLLSFVVCVLSDPGHVPSSYAPDIEVNKVSAQEIKRNVSYLFTYPLFWTFLSFYFTVSYFFLFLRNVIMFVSDDAPFFCNVL